MPQEMVRLTGTGQAMKTGPIPIEDKGLSAMRRAVAILAWIGSIFLGICPADTLVAAGIRSITHAPLDNGDVLCITEAGADPPKIFLIEGKEPRLVVDFVGSEYSGTMTRIAAPGGRLVEGLRIGVHHQPEKKVRLVADLSTAEPIRWEQDYNTETGTLTLTVLPANENVRDTPEPIAESRPEAEVSPPPAAEQEQKDSGGREQLTAGLTKVKQPLVQVPETGADEHQPVHLQTPPGQPEALSANEEGETAVPAHSPPPEQLIVNVPVLTSVSFDNAFSKSGEMVLLQLSDFEPPKISTQQKAPPRIYCDFLGAEVQEGLASNVATGGRYVETIRVEQDKMRVRVVLELAPGANYDLQQVYFKEDNLFVLIVNTMPE